MWLVRCNSFSVSKLGICPVILYVWVLLGFVNKSLSQLLFLYTASCVSSCLLSVFVLETRKQSNVISRWSMIRPGECSLRARSSNVWNHRFLANKPVIFFLLTDTFIILPWEYWDDNFTLTIGTFEERAPDINSLNNWWGVPFNQSFASENGHCLVKMLSMFSHFIDVKTCFIWARNRQLLTSIQQCFLHKPAFLSGSLAVVYRKGNISKWCDGLFGSGVPL